MILNELDRKPIQPVYRHEILGHVAENEADEIIACCQFAWPYTIYPYKGLLHLKNWRENGEVGKSMSSRKMYSSVVRNDGKIVSHAALVKNKHDLWELGRVFSLTPGIGTGTEATIGCLKQAEKIGASYVYMGRSYNRTPMMNASVKAAAVCNFNIAVIGVSPLLYQEIGDDGNEYLWGEIDSLFIKKNKPLPIIFPTQALPPVISLLNNIVTLNQSNITFEDNKLEKPRETLPEISVNDSMILVDIEDCYNQDILLQRGFKPTGILPINNHWMIRFYFGQIPSLVNSSQYYLQAGISPIYSDHYLEFSVISSILSS